MIPLRIQLKGFLCYQDEQEILLDGKNLWLMAGLNGSGKSAVFDAMTFALFGHHRGGGQQLAELINHQSPSLAVEFDFLLDGQTYRIRRTIARRKEGTAVTTQQIYRLSPPATPGGEWTKDAVADTTRKSEFNVWVRDHIGLSYETFTSSVLLLQGRADKLLDSTPSGRFEVLAGIVDLERYRRLHQRADDRRKQLKANVEVLENHLGKLPAVADEDLAQVDEALSAARTQLDQAQAEVEALQERENQARQWAALQARRVEIEERWNRAQSLLGEAEAIRKALARLTELRGVLPHLKTAQQQRANIAKAVRIADQFVAEERGLEDQLRDRTATLEQARKRLDNLKRKLARDEQKHQQVRDRLEALAETLSHVSLYDSQRDQLRRLERELGAYPPDLPARVAQLRRTWEQLSGLDKALPLLTRLQQQRTGLREARQRGTAATTFERETREKGEALKKHHVLAGQALKDAERERQQAEERATEARTLHTQSAALLKEFASLQGTKLCRHCGQELTPQHYQQEKARRETEAAEAKARADGAEAARKEALKKEQDCRRNLDDNQQALERAREDYRSHKQELQQAEKDVGRLEGDCASALHDLPDPYRQRISTNGEPRDWLATTYPSDDDLTGLRQQARELVGIRKQLNDTEAQQDHWQKLHAQHAGTRQTLTDLESKLPGDVDDLREEQIRLRADEGSLSAVIKSDRAVRDETQLEIDRLSREQSGLEKRLAEARGKLQNERTQQKLYQESVDRARQMLSEAWRPLADTVALSELNRLEGEKEQLEQAGTEARAKQLEQAMTSLDSLRQSRADLDAECDRFPPEVRVAVAEVQKALTTARQTRSTCEAAVKEQVEKRAVLEQQKKQREDVGKQLREQEGELSRYRTLAELLGRERLQRHLVRQAERQVVDHANAVLDRLSGGQLYLRLRGGDDGDAAERALELEAYNRVTASDPINVTFLSGSQRFRVAVALALGLGQYASRQHRPIESVIIDEGFGCLDRQGRQVMIQELQNLRGQLRCILLVSHQEEFADAFSDGYLFELANGATRVKRFQR